MLTSSMTTSAPFADGGIGTDIRAGVPAVDFGPRGHGAHEAVEWVSLDSVVECAHVLVETAKAFFEKE